VRLEHFRLDGEVRARVLAEEHRHGDLARPIDPILYWCCAIPAIAPRSTASTSSENQGSLARGKILIIAS